MINQSGKRGAREDRSPCPRKQHASSTRDRLSYSKVWARKEANLQPTDFQSGTTNQWFRRFPHRFRRHT